MAADPGSNTGFASCAQSGSSPCASEAAVDTRHRPVDGIERSLAGIWSGFGSRESFWPGRIVDMTVAYLVQHGEKERLPGDPGLTARGRQQATRTGRWLRGLGVHVLCTSPMRRARETAECIASVTGLTAQPDDRLRERLNWDGSMPFEAFLALWARTRQDRDFAPRKEESSRRREHGCRHSSPACPAHRGQSRRSPMAGSRPNLLCNLLGDNAPPPHLLDAGVSPCAVTAIDDLNVVMIASTTHLSLPPPERQPLPTGATRPQRSDECAALLSGQGAGEPGLEVQDS